MKNQEKNKVSVTIFSLLAVSVLLSGCVGRTGSAYFSSEPSEAEIWIDESNTGEVTPATIPDLEWGDHTYYLKKEGYEIFNGSFNIKANQTTNLPKALLTQTSKQINISQTELKYHLLGNVSRLFYCDPDFYPVARAEAEREHALEQFNDIQKNTEEFKTILNHTNLEGILNFSADQKLLIYREYKRLNSILLKPVGDVYTFQLRTSEENDTVFDIEGIITQNR